MSTKDSPWTFDDFEAGADLATVPVALDEGRIASWNRIYADAGGRIDPSAETVPRGLIVAAMMEGYIRAIQPRPPGNIHAGQTLAFTGTPVRVGARLDIAFSCQTKEFRRERRWLTFGVRVLDDDHVVAEGEISSIWAM
jgi:acyl dehydratase